MKKLITYILFALVSFSSFGQYSFDKEKNKYWIYRERLKNFMVRSHGNFCTGCDILANDRGNDDMLEWADAPWMIGYWMGTLAMEYRLLRNAGLSSNSPEVMQTKKDLYGAIQSINRLDCEAEISFGCANDCLTQNINGFLLSDDIPANFAEVQGIIDGLNDGLVPPPDDYRVKCINSGFTAYDNPGREASQDHLIGLFIGLALVKKCFGDIDVNEHWNYTPFTNAPSEAQTSSFFTEVQLISQRIINYLRSNGWMYQNKCTGKCVIGIYNDKNPDACMSLNPSENCTYLLAPGFKYCCEEGGAIAIPQAIGFAAANQFIQGTTYDPILAEVTNYATHNISWNMAINDGNRLVMTLVAIGNIWKTGTFIQWVPQTVHVCLPFNVSWCHCCWVNDTYTINIPTIVTYSSTTVQVSDHLVNASKGNNHWEHLYLLHKFLHGSGSSNISDDYYKCLLNAASCRGYDGLNGGSLPNKEWSCVDRLDGSRDCNLSDAGNNGTGYMFYFNLFNSVQSQGSHSPISINNLALYDINKSNYVEYDKKNFHAAHNITAQDYEITKLFTEGQGRVNFAAGNKIILGDGFKVTNGGYFHGYIDPAIGAMNCSDPPSQTDCGFAGKTASVPDTIADLDSVIAMIAVQDSFTNALPCPIDTLYPHAKDFDSTATNFYWDFGNGQTSNLESPAIYYSYPGNYIITLIVANPSKTDTFSTLIAVPNCNFNARIGNQKFTTNPYKMSTGEIVMRIIINPNPSATGVFHLSVIGNQVSVKNITITNLLGETIFVSELRTPNIELNLSRHPKGIYFVKLTTAEGQMDVKKIVYQ